MKLELCSLFAQVFADEFPDLVVQVNLTVLLVLASLYVHIISHSTCFHFKHESDIDHFIHHFSFIGISQSILATSYVKWIDVWMIFTMVVPFLEAS